MFSKKIFTYILFSMFILNFGNSSLSRKLSGNKKDYKRNFKTEKLRFLPSQKKTENYDYKFGKDVDSIVTVIKDKGLYKLTRQKDEMFSFDSYRKKYLFRKDSSNELIYLDKYINKEQNYSLETTVRRDPDLILSNLLSLKLDSFSDDLNEFFLNNMSFHDFYKWQPGRSLYFFFRGLLLGLPDKYNIKIKTNLKESNDNVKNDINTVNKNKKSGKNVKRRYFPVYSTFKISKGDSDFLSIKIDGVPEITTLEFSKEKLNQEKSMLKIKYNKQKLFSKNNIITTLSDVDSVQSFDFLKSITENNSMKLFENKYILNKIIIEELRDSDIKTEKDFHNFILGVIKNTTLIDYLASNAQKGSGRPDIILKKPLNKYIVELKVFKKKDNVYKILSDAMNQIDAKGYIGTATSKIKRGRFNEYLIAIALNLDTKEMFCKWKQKKKI